VERSTRQTHILVVSSDPSLKEEIQEAVRLAGRVQAVIHSARDLTRAVELTRDRFPNLILLEMTGELEGLKAVVRELLAVSPESLIAGVYRPDTFSAQVWERAPQGAVFVETLRVGVRDFLRRPVSTADMDQLLERIRDRAAPPAVLGATIAFISNKGGVGKARRFPGEVLLIDASLQMGVCAPMLDLKPQTTLLDAIRERPRLDTTLIRQLATPHSSGLELLAAPPDAVSATEIDADLLTRVLNLARRTYRFVVIDTFPLFDRIVMSILDACDLAYIVVDNVVPTILSGAYLMKLLDGLEFPRERRRLAVNRFQRVAGNPSLDDVTRLLGRAVDHSVPYHNRAITAANVGRPFTLSHRPFSKLDRSLKRIVAEIEAVGRVPKGTDDGQSLNGRAHDRAPTKDNDE
jgi:pilus assembly protein CpaE